MNTRRSLKRKLEENFALESRDLKIPAVERGLAVEIRRHVETLEFGVHRAAAKVAAAHALVQIVIHEDYVRDVVDCGAVPALIKNLTAPPLPKIGCGSIPYEYEVVRLSAKALCLIAAKPETQQLIVDAGALPPLIRLLKSQTNCPAGLRVIRRAADAIANIAHENLNIKNTVRIEGGITALVGLLSFFGCKVQIAAAQALKTLAFKNIENKNQIVECGALPNLVLMLQSSVACTSNEAVGVIGNLVHSSPTIKDLVLAEGALQPIIDLLSSSCVETQKETALLLGQFATPNSDCKVHIVQRGAVQPLIRMLLSPDSQVQEMSAFAIGRLAQDKHNQAGIAHNGGIAPLLKLLDSKNESLQHNAAFALYGLADNEDNIAALIKFGLVQKFQDGRFLAQRTRDCIERTMARLEVKISEGKIAVRVLNNLLYLMRASEKVVQSRVVLALAYLCKPENRKFIFIEHKGLELLLGLLESKSLIQQNVGCLALHRLATKSIPLSQVDAVPHAPNPVVHMGEKYVNNPTVSDITFLVDGKQFFAHRNCLVASSEIFRAMLDGGYRERDAKDVEIPNIRWDVFELMMRYIYAGSVEINSDIAHDLLKAADQYLLEGLKHQCALVISQDISVENISLMFDLSEAFNVKPLYQACILFVLQNVRRLCRKSWYPALMKRTIPEIRSFFAEALAEHNQCSSSEAKVDDI